MLIRYADVNGLRVRYLEDGSGPPLVFLHGGGWSADHGGPPTDGWSGYFPLLADRYRVIAPDGRGHGETPNPAGNLSYALMAEDVIGLCETLGVDGAVFWGFSAGANIAQEVGIRAPTLARALIQHGGVVACSDTYLEVVSAFFCASSPDGPPDADAMEEQFPEYVARVAPRHEAQGAGRWRDLVRELYAMLVTPRIYTDTDLARITAPTLLVTGDRDQFQTVEEHVAFYRRLPNAELAVLPGVDHNLPGDPNGYIALVEDFLDRRAPV